jgi:hypothetical protein
MYLAKNKHGVSRMTFAECVQTNACPIILPDAVTMVDFWNRMYNHWFNIKLQNSKIIIVRNEDIIEDPEGRCSKIASDLGLTRISPTFLLPTAHMTECSSKYDTKFLYATNKTLTFDKQYYTSRAYLKHYTPEILEFIRSNVDTNLMKTFGYEII